MLLQVGNWISAHPWLVMAPFLALVYVSMGALIGVLLKWRFLRHRWTKHKVSVPFSIIPNENCWCESTNAGGLVVFSYGSAPILWPLVLVAWILVKVVRVLASIINLPIRAYSKILEMIRIPEEPKRVVMVEEDTADLRTAFMRQNQEILRLKEANELLLRQERARAGPFTEEKIDNLLKKSDEVLREMDERGTKGEEP